MGWGLLHVRRERWRRSRLIFAAELSVLLHTTGTCCSAYSRSAWRHERSGILLAWQIDNGVRLSSEHRAMPGDIPANVSDAFYLMMR